MVFCKLSPGQIAEVVFIETIEAAPVGNNVTDRLNGLPDEAFLAVRSRQSLDVQCGLATCQVSCQSLAQEKHSKLFVNTFKQTALVTIAALEGAGIIPAAAEPGLKELKLELKFTPDVLLIRAADFVHGL
jgi:hypothetical protein